MGEEESSKISAGENIIVIHTPKGLFIRTKTGRIYSVNTGNQINRSGSRSAAAAWRSESQSMSQFDVWGGNNSGVDDIYNMQYNTTPRVTSMLNDDPYGVRYMPQSLSAESGFSSSVDSSATSNDVSNIDPMYFLNTATSGDEDSAWNSSVVHQSVGNIMSDEVPFIKLPQQRVYQDNSGLRVHQSSRYSDLPSDLLCLDTSCVTDRTDTSDPTLPALTVRDQQNDTDSLDSLTFDDYYYGGSSRMDPMLNGYHSSLYNTHSIANATVTSASFANAATATDALDVGDISDTAADWNQLSAMMNDDD